MIRMDIMLNKMERKRSNKIRQFLFGNVEVNRKELAKKIILEKYPIEEKNVMNWGNDVSIYLGDIGIVISSYKIEFKFPLEQIEKVQEIIQTLFAGERIYASFGGDVEQLFQGTKLKSITHHGVDIYHDILVHTKNVQIQAMNIF